MDFDSIFNKWYAWYLNNKSQFTTGDEMVKDAFRAGYESASKKLIEYPSLEEIRDIIKGEVYTGLADILGIDDAARTIIERFQKTENIHS